MGPSEHYRLRREALTELVAGLSDEQLATTVPGCPAWSVKDVVGHLAGLTADVCSGTMDGAGTPTWTQAQVDARRDTPIGAVLEEWRRRGPGLEAELDGMGFLGWVFAFDAVLHTDDVREALGLPPYDDQTAVELLDVFVPRLTARAEGLGTLTLHAAGHSWTVGEGVPDATVTAPSIGALSRAVGDRRTDEQLRALTWTADPEPWIRVLPLFRGSPGRP